MTVTDHETGSFLQSSPLLAIDLETSMAPAISPSVYISHRPSAFKLVQTFSLDLTRMYASHLRKRIKPSEKPESVAIDRTDPRSRRVDDAKTVRLSI
jgi:hypothetical protein